MKVSVVAPLRLPTGIGALPGPVPMEIPGLPRPAAPVRHSSPPGALAEELFTRVARLAAMVLDTPWASVTVAGEGHTSGRIWLVSPEVPDRPGAAEEALRQYVIRCGLRLAIGGIRRGLQMSAGPAGPANVIAWAGFPVRSRDGRVVGSLCVADHLPRRWSSRDVEVLRILADVAAGEVALQAALRHSAERAALAQTLQESLLPPRLPEIPGLQVAARYAAGGTGAEVLGDFYDVFPSVRGSWGIAVGDVCGKGAPAAKSTALARYTLRAEAHRETRPSVILAALNQALLDWLTDDPRFLTAIYATIRPTVAGASVRISSGGHPLALVRRANGHVQAAGQPGTLLGLLPHPELHDSRSLLRAGDSLILFTDGVTEARSHIDRGLYGDGRLHDFIAGLDGMPAARIAEAIQQVVRSFSGGKISDDMVTLVLAVPRHKAGGRAARGSTWHAARPAAGRTTPAAEAASTAWMPPADHDAPPAGGEGFAFRQRWVHADIERAGQADGEVVVP
jgi:phosphoserine phosphatase RsbU/P